MNYQTVQSGRIPLLVRRGGCGINKKSRSHRSAADGVVAHTQMFQNAFRNVTRERPPHPRLFGRGPFFNGAATPPLQGGEYARLNSFTASMTAPTETGLVSIFLLHASPTYSHSAPVFWNKSALL